MSQIDGVSAISIIMISSFAIERIATGMLFLLSFIKPWSRRFPNPMKVSGIAEREDAEAKHKLIFFVFAGILGIPVLAGYGEVRILRAVLGNENINYILDTIFTGLTLAAGSDRIADLLKMHSTPQKKKQETRPIEVTGKLVLEEEMNKKISRAQES